MIPRKLLAAALGLSALGWAALPAGAQGPPHWSSANQNIDCTTQCHTGHQAAGSQLTAAAGNVNLCLSCHSAAGLAADRALNAVDVAIPGTAGTSHAFDVSALGKYDIVLPSDTDMAQMMAVFGNQVVCSSCHDQHRAKAAFGGTPSVSQSKQITALGSTGAVTSGGTYSGAEGSWYLVEVTTGGSDLANVRFRWSKDNGISWMAENVSANGGAAVALDSGVTVIFGAGNYGVGERWQFYGAWPFLRRALDDAGKDSALCLECHGAWEMDWTDSGGTRQYTGTNRSHPVGVALNANSESYDRPAPLDADGSADDGNPTNNLVLGAQGVSCLTCHGVHYVDSNSASVDGP